MKKKIDEVKGELILGEGNAPMRFYKTAAYPLEQEVRSKRTGEHLFAFTRKEVQQLKKFLNENF